LGLFGNNEEKRAKAAASELEAERLRALPLEELAAEVLPAFGADGMAIKSGHQRGAMQVVSWLLPDAGVKHRQPLLGPAIEALGALEHADLLTRAQFGRGSASTYRLSRLGETALNEGTVRERLA